MRSSLIGVLPIALLVGCAAPPATAKVAQPEQAPQWVLASDPSSGVWRLNQKTGELQYCTFGGDARMHCQIAPVDAPDNVLSR